jgi:hypothetical protein
MWQPGHVEPAPESSTSSGSTASQNQFWDGRVWTACGFPQPANTLDAENIPVPVDMDAESSNPSGSTASQTKFWDGRVWTAPGFPQPANTPDAENPNNAAATRPRRTRKQYDEHIEEFNSNNVEGERMDKMYKKFSHEQWDYYLFSLDDNGLAKSWNWNRLKWYEWYLTARARSEKQAQEEKQAQAEAFAQQAEALATAQAHVRFLLHTEACAKTARQVANAMYGNASCDNETPFSEPKRKRHF